MKKMSFILPVLCLSVPVDAGAVVKITEDARYRYITSNGLPDHKTGRFPNSGNPHSIQVQNHNYKVPLVPVKTNHARAKRGVVGVAVNGIPFEPATAEYYQRDRSSGLNYEAIGGSLNLGLDYTNAHVQPTGAYHYHGVPVALLGRADSRHRYGMSFVGYAADGFPLFAAAKDVYQSSYRLKSGMRSSGPGGRYDGRFTSDYEFVEGAGDLDRCNGMRVDGQYFYVLTHSFPFIPRCLYGQADQSFERRRDGGRIGGRPDSSSGNFDQRSWRPPPRHFRR